MKYILLCLLSFGVFHSWAFDYKRVYDNSINNLTWKYQNPSNSGGAIAWYDGRTLMSLMTMYRATGDINYLKKLITHGDLILQNKNSASHTDYDGVGRIGGVDEANECDLPYSWVVHAGMITYPLADFCQLVLNSPTDPNTPNLTNYSHNGKTFLQHANDFFIEIKEVIDSYDGDWSSSSGAYLFPANFATPRCFDSAYDELDELPYNMSNAMGRTLLMMHKADINNQYGSFLSKLTSLANQYKAAIDFALVFGDLDGLLYNHVATGITRNEDISHAGINVDFIRLCYENNIVFSSSYLDYFADYFSSSLYISPTKIYKYLDQEHETKTDTIVGFYEWIALNDQNLDLYRYIEEAMIEDLVKDQIFTDGRRLLGLSYLHLHRVKLWPVSYSTSNGPDAAVADLHLGDLDNDGKDELVTVRNFDGHIDSYKINVDGTLSSYAHSYGYGAASQWAGVTVGNFDVSTPEEEIAAVRNFDGKIFIWKANSNGTLSLLASTSGGSSLQWAGIEAGNFDPSSPGDELALVRNLDGDIFLYKYNSGTITLVTRNYGPGSASNWKDLTSGDFDGDGKDEIIGLRGFDEKLYVYNYNGSTGTIVTDFNHQLPSGGNYKAITAYDFDGDGNVELALQYGISGNMFFYESDGSQFIHDWTEFWSTLDNIYALGSGKFRTDQTGGEVFFVRSNQNILGFTAGIKKIVIRPKSASMEGEGNGLDDLIVYPNPSNGKSIQLACENCELEEGYGYIVSDLRGAQIISKSGHKGNRIDIEGLKSGVYLLQIELRKKTYLKKVIVQ